MADVAAAVVSFVGLGGQVLQGLTVLYGFFEDIRDAPRYVQTLKIELLVLRGIVERIESQRTTNDVAVQNALKYCLSWTEKLEKLIRKYDPTAVSSRRKRLWNDIHVAFRKEKLGKYTEALRRAKELFTDASFATDHAVILETISRTQVTANLIQSNVDQIKERQGFLNSDATASLRMLSEIESTTKSIQAAIQDLKNLRSSLAGNQPSESDLSYSGHSTKHSLQRCFDELFSNPQTLASNGPPKALLFDAVPQDRSKEPGISDFRAAAESLVDKSPLQICRFAPIFKEILERSVSERVRIINERVSDKHARLNLSPPATVHLNPRKRWFASYNFWFGTLLVSTDHVEKYESQDTSRSLVSCTENKFTFLPRPWLFWKGLCLAVRKWGYKDCSQLDKVFINPLVVISDNHSIACAIRRHDVELVRGLICNGLVSPFSQLADGTTLLSLCIRSMTNQLRGHPLFSQQDRDLAVWLLDLGVDPGVQDRSGL
jgi:hypothetical protein